MSDRHGVIQVVDVNAACKNVTVANFGAAPAQIELLVSPAGVSNNGPPALDMVN